MLTILGGAYIMYFAWVGVVLIEKNTCTIIFPKYSDRLIKANSGDSDQTNPRGAV